MMPRLDLGDLREAARQHCGGHFYVGFSGGLDSTVLLHVLVEAGVAPLTAIHIHHGLQAQADAWVGHSTRVCAVLGVPIVVERVHVAAEDRQGPEAAAREARYSAFRTHMKPGDCLVVAHHRDDQTETVLLRLLRGTGIDGLAAMREWVDFPPGRLWRPLLGVPRAVLREWAQTRGLSWVEDPQNREFRFRRVWIRRRLLPHLEAATPGIDERLARLASQAARVSDRCAEQTRASLAQLAAEDEDGTLPVAALRAMSGARRHMLLRAWLRSRGFAMPTAAVLERLDREVLAARADAQPVLRFAGCELRRYQGRLYSLTPLPLPPAASLVWESGSRLELPAGCGRLLAACPPPQALRVFFPCGGERLRPASHVHTRTLKNLFQEAEVPPWQRRRTPLVCLNGELVWAGGLEASQAWRQWCRDHAWAMEWQANFKA